MAEQVVTFRSLGACGLRTTIKKPCSQSTSTPSYKISSRCHLVQLSCFRPSAEIGHWSDKQTTTVSPAQFDRVGGWQRATSQTFATEQISINHWQQPNQFWNTPRSRQHKAGVEGCETYAIAPHLLLELFKRPPVEMAGDRGRLVDQSPSGTQEIRKRSSVLTSSAPAPGA